MTNRAQKEQKARGSASEIHMQGAIFDLDGVITKTARVHAIAWKELFDDYLRSRQERYGEPFKEFEIETDYLGLVDGKPRYMGVQSFIESRGIKLPFGDPEDGPEKETYCGLGNRKQGFFVRLVDELGVQIFEPAIALLLDLKSRGLPLAVATSSKNCQLVLKKADLEDVFDVRVDGIYAAKEGLLGKPKPDVFVKTAALMGVDPRRTVVFEDAVSGVQAASAGNFGLVLGVDSGGIREALWEGGADLVYPDLSALTFEKMDWWFCHRELARPSALRYWQELQGELASKCIALFINFDSIIKSSIDLSNSDQSMDEFGQILAEISGKCPVCIKSALEQEQLKRQISLDNLYFLHADGLEIIGPKNSGIHRHGSDKERTTWDMGKTLDWAIEVMGLESGNTLPVYMGEDSDDEEAFMVLKTNGFGIQLTELPRSTAAHYSLQRIEDVLAFIKRIRGML